MAVPVAMVHGPAHESGTLDTVQIAGLTPDDQRLFTPPAQVTPMTCKKAVFACLDTDVTFLQLTASWTLNCGDRDVGPVGFVARPEQATQEAPKRKVRIVRTFAAILNRPLPLPPILNEFSLPAKCEFMIRSLRWSGGRHSVHINKQTKLLLRNWLTRRWWGWWCWCWWWRCIHCNYTDHKRKEQSVKTRLSRSTTAKSPSYALTLHLP